MSTDIVVIGAGGHAVSVTSVAQSHGFRVIAYVDDTLAGAEILGTSVITKQQCISLYPEGNLFIAIGDNAVRERVYLEYKDALPGSDFPALIHSSSVVGVSSKVGIGTVVMPLANVGPNSTVGNFCILNTSSSIDHDCVMGNFSSLAPGVICGGTVTIGTRSAIAIGATVKHGIGLGDDVVIGANSYVDRPMEDNVVAYGTPCKRIRGRNKGDAYLD